MSIYNNSNPNNNYIHNSLNSLLIAINNQAPNVSNPHSSNESKEPEMHREKENPLPTNTNRSESNHLHANSTTVLANVPGKKHKFNAQTTSNSNANINFAKRVRNSELLNNNSNNNSSSNTFNVTYASPPIWTNPQLNNSQTPHLSVPKPIRPNQPNSTNSSSHSFNHSLVPTQPLNLNRINHQSVNSIIQPIILNNNNSNNVSSIIQNGHDSSNIGYLINFTQITYEDKEIIYPIPNCTLSMFIKMIDNNQWLNGKATFSSDDAEIEMTVKNGLFANVVGKKNHRDGIYTGELTIRNNDHFAITGKGISEDKWGFIQEGYFHNEQFMHGSSSHKGLKLPNSSDLPSERIIGTKVNGKWIGYITHLHPTGHIIKGKIDETGIVTGKWENISGIEGYSFTGKIRLTPLRFEEGKCSYNGPIPPKVDVYIGNIVDSIWTGTLQIMDHFGTFTGQRLSKGNFQGIYRYFGEKNGLIETGEFIIQNRKLVLQNGKAEYTGPMPPNTGQIITGKRVNGEWTGEHQIIRQEEIFIGTKSLNGNGHYLGTKKGLGLCEGLSEKGEFLASLHPLDTETQYINSAPPKVPVIVGKFKEGFWVNLTLLLPDGGIVPLTRIPSGLSSFIGKRENPPQGINYDGTLVNGDLQGKWVLVQILHKYHIQCWDGQFEYGQFQRGIIFKPSGEIIHKID